MRDGGYDAGAFPRRRRVLRNQIPYSVPFMSYNCQNYVILWQRSLVKMNAAKAANTEPIPGYRLNAPLGSGGFGAVWRCEACPEVYLRPSSSSAARATVASIRTTPGPLRNCTPSSILMGKRHPFLLSMDRVEFVEDGDLVITVMELADVAISTTCWTTTAPPAVPASRRKWS